MIEDRELTDFIEAERYELFAAPEYNFPFDRRQFLKTFGLGILFVVPATRTLAQEREQEETGRGRSNNNVSNDVGAWIHVDEAGGVTAFTGKVEFGQNIRTSLTQSSPKIPRLRHELCRPYRASIFSGNFYPDLTVGAIAFRRFAPCADSMLASGPNGA